MKATAIFCKSKSKWMHGGKLLMWAEKIPFSHAAVLIEDQHGHQVVYESVWPKSRKMTLKEWEKHYQCVESYSFPIASMSDLHQMKFFMKSKLNKWYSVLQLAWIGVGMFINPLEKIVSTRPVNGSKHLICTELTGDFFAKFYGCKWLESTDTISLTETRNEIQRVWGQNGNSFSSTGS